jgi:MFS family permease
MGAADLTVDAGDAAAAARHARAGGGLRGAWAARVGGLPAAYWRIWTGTLVNRLGTFVEPFLALYLTTTRGLGVGEAGGVLAAFGAGSVLAQPVGGSLADRIGRRATLAGSLGVSALLLAALAVVHAVWLIVLVVALLGLIGDAYRPASQAAVADLVPFAERRRASGLIFWAINLGFSAAAVFGGLLATAGYGLLFTLDAITCGVFAVIILRFVPETRPAAAARASEAGVGYGAVLRDRTFSVLLAVQTLVAIGLVQLFVVLPLAMDHDGLSVATYGWVAALNGLTIVVAHPLLSPALLRRSPTRVLALGGLLVTVSFAVFAVADGALAYALGIVIFSLAEICGAAVGPGLVAELAPPALRGRYAGLHGLTFGVGAMVAPIVGTQLLGPGDSARPWVACGALALVAAAGFLLLGGAVGRRRSAAAAVDQRLDGERREAGPGAGAPAEATRMLP